jgi:hypothetical protein
MNHDDDCTPMALFPMRDVSDPGCLEHIPVDHRTAMTTAQFATPEHGQPLTFSASRTSSLNNGDWVSMSTAQGPFYGRITNVRRDSVTVVGGHPDGTAILQNPLPGSVGYTNTAIHVVSPVPALRKDTATPFVPPANGAQYKFTAIVSTAPGADPGSPTAFSDVGLLRSATGATAFIWGTPYQAVIPQLGATPGTNVGVAVWLPASTDTGMPARMGVALPADGGGFLVASGGGFYLTQKPWLGTLPAAASTDVVTDILGVVNGEIKALPKVEGRPVHYANGKWSDYTPWDFTPSGQQIYKEEVVTPNIGLAQGAKPFDLRTLPGWSDDVKAVMVSVEYAMIADTDASATESTNSICRVDVDGTQVVLAQTYGKLDRQNNVGQFVIPVLASKRLTTNVVFINPRFTKSVRLVLNAVAFIR